MMIPWSIAGHCQPLGFAAGVESIVECFGEHKQNDVIPKS
jgi:hypothetical protein